MDDDGILDTKEATFGTSLDVADTDKDGLSDGLEVGLASPQTDLLGMAWTALDTPLAPCPTARKAWQPFQGSGGFFTAAKDADSDNDGILDGLEDLNHNGVFGDNGELYPRDWTNPNNPSDIKKGNDYDNDGLLDGLELLLWGHANADGNGGLTYDFCQIASTWGSDEGSWAGRMSFDSATADPFQTNPRSPTSDTDLVPDGQDLNPRDDAALAVEFGLFQMTEDFDSWKSTPWAERGTMELFVGQLLVTLPLGLGQYVIKMNDVEHVKVYDAKRKQLLPDNLFEKLADHNPNRLIAQPTPSTLETLWKVDKVLNGRQVLQFDIPDDVGNPQNVNLQNTAVTVGILARDDDEGLNGGDHDIDLNPVSGTNPVTLSLDLASDFQAQYTPDSLVANHGGAYQTWRKQLETIRGDMVKKDNDEDGSLEIRMGDTVPSFFLDNLRNKGQLPVTQNCYGTSACIPPTRP